jgi:hypothetical protein
MSIELAVGGVTERCGICGRCVIEETTGVIGLNGVLCDECTVNLGHYTPSWAAIESPHGTFEVYVYRGYRGTPFAGAVGGVFVNFNEGVKCDAREVAGQYHRLTTEEQRLIWEVSAGEFPDDYEIVEPEWCGDYRLAKAFSYRADDDHPFFEVQSYLPRPYIVEPGRVIVTGEVPSHTKELFEGSAESDFGQKKLGGSESGGQDEDITVESRSDDRSDGGEDNRTQAGLSAF